MSFTTVVCDIVAQSQDAYCAPLDVVFMVVLQSLLPHVLAFRDMHAMLEVFRVVELLVVAVLLRC